KGETGRGWRAEEAVGLGSSVHSGALVGYPRDAQGGGQCPPGLGAASAPADPPSCLSAPRNRPEGKVLETVGVFEAPKQHGKYETGQLFLHSVFGYRGIVLFPWQARLYDRDVASPVTEKSENVAGHGSKEVKGKTHTYYQVLIDARDCPHISQRSQTEAVTFLANHDDSRALYAIPGLDYVSHEDILPYSSTDQVPIQHELFERFLMYDQTKVPPFVARDTLCAWQEKNHPWLELSDVHRETTENIRVTVIPFYMGMREAQNSHVYWWRYCIRLENLDSEVVQLRERHWRIFSLSGTLETVRGRGVVGREPVLSKEQPAFQYSSHVSLQASSGHMCSRDVCSGISFHERGLGFNSISVHLCLRNWHAGLFPA
uniref:DNA polymerase delta interacting protein 2 n=1 Tax=Cyanoderma ruficeps TaxID=181631 RepID=A0A8C3P2Z5_9PASS